MDRNRKRKAGGAASPEVENSAGKRQKTTTTVVTEQETPATTSKIGLQLIDHLKSAKDKTGRLIAELFIKLPTKRELPDYYRTIKLPIAIQTVQDRLERHEYPNLSAVESDMKRIVSNAKQYNDDKSIVYQDAERIRKALSNFMTKHNPAYKDPSYVALPTPIPGQNDDASASSQPSTRDASEQPRKIKISLKATRDRKSSVVTPGVSSPSLPAPVASAVKQDHSPTDFAGMTFQQAQEHVITGLITYTDQGIEIFQPFVTLPPRALTDYYKIIKKPMSLTGVRKRVRGQHGRDAATSQSDFKSWDSFEQEVSYIWRNAREYNEDGSDMYNLSVELEQIFKERLAAAKSQIDEPQLPKLKLNAPRPKAVLKLGARGSPAPREDKKEDATTRALPKRSISRRSSSLVPAMAATDKATCPVPSSPNAATTAATAAATTTSTATASAVKTEKPLAASPLLATVRPQSIAPEATQSPRPGTGTNSMPPPPSVRKSSTDAHSVSLLPPPPPPVKQYPPSFAELYTRTKPVDEALLPNLVIATHPQLNLSKRFHINIPASSKFTQQSVAVALPAASYYVSVMPTVNQRLLAARQYKLFVTANGMRLMVREREGRMVYDTSLNPGVNRLEIEVVSVGGKAGALEVEKVMVFANLIK